jgi:hypothetical protein
MALDKEKIISADNKTVIAELLSWPARFLLAFVSFAGTAVYAGSFLLINHTGLVRMGDDPGALAFEVGIASAISWPLFGLAMLLVTRSRPSILAWVDTCLVTQNMGIAVLMLSALLNLILYASGSSMNYHTATIIHIIIILVADTVMAAIFVRRASRIALSRLRALALWVLVLNGIFVLLLALL